MLARSKRPEAGQIFREALGSDIGDIQGGTTPEGIHLRAMAGIVDLLQRGLTGIEWRGDVLRDRNGSDPAWSPHASKLIFVRGQMVHAAFWRYGLFTVRADGSGLRRVNTPGAGGALYDVYPDHPTWSPDGKLISYHASNSGVWVQRIDGRRLRQLATSGVGATYHLDAQEPDWQPLPRP